MPADAAPRATHWLSHDLTALPAILEKPAHGATPAQSGDDLHFDVVIVGSGYGAAMVLHELAGHGTAPDRPLRIAVIERGKEYLPGMFPSRMSDLAGHVRFSTRGQADVRGRASGLFDVRVGPDMGVLVANGLGGGSLINAGVMEAPLPAVFQHSRWPAAIRADATLVQQCAHVQQLLGAAPFLQSPAREQAMGRLGAGHPVRPVAITVAGQDDPENGVAACIACGDCATGCNFRAKLSLDATLFAQAMRRHGRKHLHVISGATAQDLRRLPGAGFELDLVHTDAELLRRQVAPLKIRTGKLVIAAGSLGSTELLKRASRAGLALSQSQLGRKFSGNGDNLSAVYGMAQATHAVADENTAHARRGVGPTITRMIDRRTQPDAGFVVQDFAIPGPLRRMLEEIATTGAALAALTRFDCANYTDPAAPDAAGIDRATIERTMVVGLIGQDDADGELEFGPGGPGTQSGTLGVSWPALRDDPRPDACQAALTRMAAHGHPSASVIPNPAWRPLPASIDNAFGTVRGAALTVHPLGGCAMADGAENGVVNALGQVFSGACGNAVYTDLVVLDGSIIPVALGINPALTIAMLARRAARSLRDDVWKFVPAAADAPEPPGPRPFFAQPAAPLPQPSTRVEFNERMVARAVLEIGRVQHKCRLELRLQFQPQDVHSLIASDGARVLTLDPERSVLRLLPSFSEADVLEVRPSPATVEGPTPPPLLEIPLSGQLRLVQMAPSFAPWRTLVAIVNWVRNRALRDLFSLWRERRDARRAPPPAPVPRRRASIGQRLSGWLGALVATLKLASHAGNRRQLEYQLMLGQPSGGDPAWRALARTWSGHCIGVTKTITYAHAANPVNQFTFADMQRLHNLTGLRLKSTLRVDYNYFAQIGVPLLRIAEQADQPRALVDLASLALYLVRVLLPLHAWTFRLPDRPRPAAPTAPHPADGLFCDNPNLHRLPGVLPGLPVPRYTRIELPATCERPKRPQQVACLLTRYGSGAKRTPNAVLMIHGYSASGTTFAHRLLPGGGLAGALARAGHDVWVLDLRSSAGMPTAQCNWTFEQMGCQDIAMAIDHIFKETQEKIDVVAHCMGAAMLSLGLFGQWSGANTPDQCPAERAAMPGRIRRIVFSQVGPAIVMSPTNTARAYVFSWLRHYLRLGAYEFLPRRPDRADDMLDRLLNLVPYPRIDFARENPFWRPWQRTAWAVPRHRMDALYGVTFNLARMGDDVLDAIDDFFGPMNLETVAQVIAFARHRLVTDHAGNTSTMVPAAIAKIRDCQVLCLHAEENDLADVSTRGRLLHLLAQAQLSGTSVRLQEVGHQDSLIGVRARSTYDLIGNFLR